MEGSLAATLYEGSTRKGKAKGDIRPNALGELMPRVL